MKATTLAVFGALTLLYSPKLTAQKLQITENTVTARLIRYELKQEYQDEYRKVLSDYVQQALADESNIMAEAYYEQENPSILWLIERWTGKKEMVSLNEAAPVSAVRVYTIKDLEPLSKQQWRRTAKKEDKPITIMLFVDSKSGTEEDFKKLYHTAMPQFRSEPGVVTYQLSEIEGDGTQFVTYEKFRSDQAFQYHLKFPPIQPVIDYLNTSIKKPPFQQGIRNLVEFAPLTRE